MLRRKDGNYEVITSRAKSRHKTKADAIKHLYAIEAAKAEQHGARGDMIRKIAAQRLQEELR